MSSKFDFTMFYISVVEDMGDDGPVGFNVYIKPLRDRSDLCDQCGVRPAEYLFDASADLGIGSSNEQICQYCAVYGYTHQDETGDSYHLIEPNDPKVCVHPHLHIPRWDRSDEHWCWACHSWIPKNDL